VLVVGGEAAVGGADGPAVAVEGDAACGSGDDGLDGDDEPFGEEMACVGVGIVGDAGLFVNGAADAVAAEFADDVKAAAADFALDGAADVFGAVAGAGGGESLAEGAVWKPSFTAVRSSLTRSPGRMVRGPGMPWTTSSLMEMQTSPGKL
jgi:hypothetical protein